jgi:hypothetical protein
MIFLAVSKNFFSSNCSYLCSFFLWTSGIRKEATRSLMKVSGLFLLSSILSRKLFRV